jgi:ParB/RepB/Spo0J family partition protein
MSPTATAPFSATDFQPAIFDLLELDQVVESPLNPRRHVDNASLDDLVASIRAHGIIEPIVVREMHDEGTGDSAYEVVAGARRTRAARLAGLTEVPAMVRQVTDAELLEIALQENIHRASMSPIDEALALEKLATLDPIYRDPQVLAGKIGRSASYVRDRLKLLRLQPVVQEALSAGAITASHAERIARLPVDQHAVALEHCFSQLFLGDEDADDLADVPELIAAARWPTLAPSLVSLDRLAGWIRDHGKVDLAAPEVQEQLRPTLEAALTDDVDAHLSDAQVVAAAATLVQLSEDYLNRKDAAALRVLAAGDWKELTATKDACPHQQRGAVVHGGPFRVVDVCAQKRKCEKHWPKPKAAAQGSAAAPKQDTWQEQQRKREEARKAWEAALPQAGRAFVAHLTTVKPTLFQVVKATIGAHDLKRIREVFGVDLTEKTALLVLLLDGVRTWSLEDFGATTSTYTFDAKGWKKKFDADQARAGKAKLDAQRTQLSGVDAVVWKAMGRVQGGHGRFRAAVESGSGDKVLDAVIRQEFGTGGYIGSDCEYHTTNGALAIAKPTKATLTVPQVRFIVRRLVESEIAAGKTGAAKKTAKKGGRK